MKGILILAHGSRQKTTEQTLEAVVDMARGELGDAPINMAYMEFGKPDISEGLNALAAQGVDEVAAVPYFLFDGIHIREDIPELLSAYEAEHPGMRIKLGRPLGVDSRLAAVLADRVRECL